MAVLYCDTEAEELLGLSFSSFGFEVCCVCCDDELDLCSEEDGADRCSSFSRLGPDFSAACVAGTHFFAAFNFFFRWKDCFGWLWAPTRPAPTPKFVAVVTW